MHISAVTDQLFELAQPLAVAVADIRLTLPEPDLGMDMNLHALAVSEAREMDVVGTRLKEIIGNALENLLPGVAQWYKGEAKPDAQMFWVVSPYSRRIMGPMFTSVALQDGDTLLTGVFFDWRAQQIATGEQGLGASVFEEALQVSGNELRPDSRYMFHLPGVSGSDGERAAFRDFSGKYGGLLTFLESAAANTRPVYNNVMENVPISLLDVAQGDLDFVLASGFSYPDVAAVVVVVEEAGGRCTDFSGGRAGLYNGTSLFCSNKAIHAEVMAAAAVL